MSMRRSGLRGLVCLLFVAATGCGSDGSDTDDNRDLLPDLGTGGRTDTGTGGGGDAGTDTRPGVDTGGVIDTGISCGDRDDDGVCDDDDLCDGFDDTIDGDGDTIPDACDVCEGDDTLDRDFDGTPDDCDLCDGELDSRDSDGDTIPDGCDVCEGDDTIDTDGDGVPDECDTCVGDNNGADSDGDGVSDVCDLCPGEDDRLDADGDTIPDACDACEDADDLLDTDEDGVSDECDRCPFDNPDDGDGDGFCDSYPIGRDVAVRGRLCDAVGVPSSAFDPTWPYPDTPPEGLTIDAYRSTQETWRDEEYTGTVGLQLSARDVFLTTSDGVTVDDYWSWREPPSNLRAVDVRRVGSELHYLLAPATGDSVFSYTDPVFWDVNTRFALEMLGPIVLRAEDGGEVAQLEAQVLVASNWPTSDRRTRFHFLSAPLCSVVTLRGTITMDAGFRFEEDTFDRVFRYTPAVDIDFEDYLTSLP